MNESRGPDVWVEVAMAGGTGVGYRVVIGDSTAAVFYITSETDAKSDASDYQRRLRTKLSGEHSGSTT
jgi:hypothetical protein